MRVLEIRLKNLNSLVGDWTINFTGPEYTSGGLFAITGPTGAGKTTILDAICLALYGRTPRLGKVSKGGSEVMSRQTNECLAEVTFETDKGLFRCCWSQRRARGKGTGELQQPKHEIVDARSGTVLNSGARAVDEQVVAVTGMNFERFTRSMLLAQGGFAAFLEAPPAERAPILEQITGTEIYSELSIKVHERRAEEKRCLESLEASLAAVSLLEISEEEKGKERLEELSIHYRALIKEKERLSNALLWLKTIADLKEELKGIEIRSGELQKRKEALQADAQRLKQAEQALILEGHYATLSERCQAIQRDQEELARLQQRAKASEGTGLQESIRQLSEQLAHDTEAKAQHEQELDRLIEKMTLLRRIRDLEEERCHLVNDTACPLCGSLDHPYTYGALPSIEAADISLRQAQEKDKGLARRIANGQLAIHQKEKELERFLNELERQKELEKSLEQRSLVLEKEKEAFRVLLRLADFSSEEDYLKARLSEAERRRLRKAIDDLEKEAIALSTRHEDKIAKLSYEEGLLITTEDEARLQAEANGVLEAIAAAQEEGAALKARLNENERRKVLWHERASVCEKQRKETTRWGALHQLIGSADGKKYRTFVQGLTFEMMVAHANSRLEKMTDRYQLKLDPTQSLELQVIDSYQGGECRSTKNLSGGESFLVSLSLALGLSYMASRNVRLDSLFLDEGFGTLDDEALEAAIETLAGLRHDGKLIGVISHVPALKERIGTRIQVTPHSRGRSLLEGPGCSS